MMTPGRIDYPIERMHLANLNEQGAASYSRARH
jgi:hypothetical protein